MKKRKFAGLLVLGAVGFLMVSCGGTGGAGKWAASENSIYVTKELEIQPGLRYLHYLAGSQVYAGIYVGKEEN